MYSVYTTHCICTLCISLLCSLSFGHVLQVQIMFYYDAINNLLTQQNSYEHHMSALWIKNTPSQLQIKPRKNSEAPTGFQPMTSAIPL